VICNCEVIEEGGKELFLKAPTRASALRALLQALVSVRACSVVLVSRWIEDE
jgi:hypothetical protein